MSQTSFLLFPGAVRFKSSDFGHADYNLNGKGQRLYIFFSKIRTEYQFKTDICVDCKRRCGLYTHTQDFVVAEKNLIIHLFSFISFIEQNTRMNRRISKSKKQNRTILSLNSNLKEG